MLALLHKPLGHAVPGKEALPLLHSSTNKALAYATLALLTISVWMFGGTTSYRSSCMLYWARPLVMPRRVDT